MLIRAVMSAVILSVIFVVFLVYREYVIEKKLNALPALNGVLLTYFTSKACNLFEELTKASIELKKLNMLKDAQNKKYKMSMERLDFLEQKKEVDRNSMEIAVTSGMQPNVSSAHLRAIPQKDGEVWISIDE